MSMLSKILSFMGGPLKGIIKKLGGDAPIDAPGGFKMPHNVSNGPSPMARSYNAKRAAAARTPEQRAAIAKKASESRTPEERSAAAKQAAANRTPEDRAAVAKKAAATRVANQREAAKSHKAGLERAKAEARTQARLEKKYGQEENLDEDIDDADVEDEQARMDRIEQRKKEIQPVRVPENAKEKVYYNKARRDLIIAAEEEGITWIETQAKIEAEARIQRETKYMEGNALSEKERDDIGEENPQLDYPSNYRR